jgi:uncharacterized membrane protein (UPF0127 family)
MIKNTTKNIMLAENDKVCRSHLSKAKGLVFSFRKKNLVFVNRKTARTRLHMFFVFYAIDAAWLDENKKVIHKETLKPFSISKSVDARYVIEMPAGAFKTTEIGDILEFET